MGLFGSNYERAGSGIAKNAPKKKGFFRFFEIFGRKFWKLFELNLLYFLSFLPVIGAVVLALAISFQLGIILAAACLVLFAVIIGPATAAHTKILKNFVMEKPTFLVHDFFKAFRSEFKYSCIVGVLDCLLACCISAAFYVYPKLIEQSGSKVYYIFFAITLSIGVIALIMNFYIFPMLVSTNLSLKNVLKNSLALSVVALKTNIITMIGGCDRSLCAGIHVCEHQVSMILLFLLPFMPASWLGLVITFQSYPIIQKYIINPYYEQRGEVNPELAQVSASEEETVFEDMGGKEKPIEPPKKAGGKQSGGGRTHKGKGKIIS
ncbi:MAG: YesL family protein [Ruminococcus sp.]